MKVVLSWLKDYVDISLSPEELARKLTMAGLEVEEIHLVGIPVAVSDGPQEFKVTGLGWDPQTIVVAQINEVMPHPNADRLVLCKLNDGQLEHIVLTGAPNLFEYKGKGALPQPLKVAYAKEGARIYDGHQPGQVLTTLKRAKIRGVESYSMVCSEKELGISEEHEGIILLDPNAPTGMPLADYMGDVVFEVNILPNMIRNANMLGIAREISALTGQPLRQPDPSYTASGAPIRGQVEIQITNPEVNPRFVLGLIRDVRTRPSPYWVQQRLRLAGMRPINHIVDATNYVMLAVGEPLHAFDYDVLVQRAGGKTPTIITRTAAQDEKLTTLDGMEHTLNDFTVLVCDTAGALSIAGVMGGAESEVTEATRNVLLEGANWNYINIRRTMAAQKMTSEAGWRFARGIHPEMAPLGVKLGLQHMLAWDEGPAAIAQGLIDSYPLSVVDPQIHLTTRDIQRLLGIELSAQAIADLLAGLEFTCQVQGDAVVVQSPPSRMDIGEGIIGVADLAEEVARMYGYDRIPVTRLKDLLPPQRSNRILEMEEQVRDVLVGLGMQEVVNYRLTSPEREALVLPKAAADPSQAYVRLKNPMSADRVVMRRSLLSAVLDTLERNARLRERLALFEIGPIFISQGEGQLPTEPPRLALAMSGLRQTPTWDHAGAAKANLDFFDLKGVLDALLESLHVSGGQYRPAQAVSFHPGKCAELVVSTAQGETVIGVFGELHPLVKENYDFSSAPVLAADLDLERLMQVIPWRYETQPVPLHPPVLEDIALIVDESISASQVEQVIRQAGGKALAQVRLFDVFRSDAIGAGKKSLAYSLTYQAAERTLTDADATQIRQKIIRRVEQDLGAKLRSA